MKNRWIAFLLVLVMAASALLVSCNNGETVTTKHTPTDPTEKPAANLLLLANEGKSDYTIVYPQAKKWAAGIAEDLSETLLEQTGVKLDVKHDSERGANECEIRVGEVKGNRMEVLDVYRSFGTVGDMDFAIKVVGKTVYIYATTSQSVAAAVGYFTEKVVAYGKTVRYAGVLKTYEGAYKKDSNPPVSITGTSENYIEFSLGAGQLVETFCRLSYTGNGGWRIQTKGRASEAFDDFGAAQRLS